MTTRTTEPPHVSTMFAALDRLAATRWLAPDSSLASCDAEARQWLEARVDEHLAALARCGALANDELTLRVALTRSAAEACERTAALSRPAAASAHADAAGPSWSGALASAAERAEACVPPRRRERLEELARRALNASLAASPAWTASFLPAWHDDPPMHRTVCAHLAWLLAFGDDDARPSPWAPLLAIWTRGAWPLATADGGLLVYVPLIDSAGVLLDPVIERAPAEARTRRARAASTRTTALPPFDRVGLATIPRFVSYDPEPDDDGYTVMVGRLETVGPTPPPARADLPRLLALQPRGFWSCQAFALDPDELRVSIGRAADSDVHLEGDEAISRRHARLDCTSQGWAICDEGSTHGTYVGDESAPLAPGVSRVVGPGTRVWIASTLLTFAPPPADAPDTDDGPAAQARALGRYLDVDALYDAFRRRPGALPPYLVVILADDPAHDEGAPDDDAMRAAIAAVSLAERVARFVAADPDCRDAVLSGRRGETWLALRAPDVDAARATCERLRAAVTREPVRARGQCFALTGSIGVAAGLGAEFDATRALAQSAAEAAARAGGNRVMVAK